MDTNHLIPFVKKIKLVACDMDETLLGSEKEVSNRTLSAINKLRERGIAVTICTGRMFSTLEQYIELLEIEGGVIACNGGEIVDAESGEYISKKELNTRAAFDFLEFADEYGIEYSIMATSGYWTRRDSFFHARYAIYTRINPRSPLTNCALHVLEAGEEFSRDLSILKINVQITSAEKRSIVDKYLKNKERMYLTTSGKELFELLPCDVSKGAGLLDLCRYMNISAGEVCAFGDYNNDLSFLSVAGLPIAVENAVDVVKKAAVYVTGRNDEEGVADALEKLFLRD